MYWSGSTVHGSVSHSKKETEPLSGVRTDFRIHVIVSNQRHSQRNSCLFRFSPSRAGNGEVGRKQIHSLNISYIINSRLFSFRLILFSSQFYLK